MTTYKKDPYDTLEEFILKNVEDGGKVLFQFQVVPYDSKILDRTSPMLYISGKRLLYYYDNKLDVYNLNDLNFGYSGEKPNFKVWKIILETGLNYNDLDEDDFKRMMRDEFRFRFSMAEKNKASKDFLFRNHDRVQRTYQTWAMGRIIMHQREGREVTNDLLEMVNGDFIAFNQRAVLIFAFVTTIYFLMRWLLLPSVPDLLSTVVDVLYVGMLAFMGVWLYLSFQKNLKRYENIYLSYTIESSNSEKDVTNLVK